MRAYHYTTSSNFKSIVRAGFVIPRNHLTDVSDDMADASVLQVRRHHNLADYVPLYLSPIPPMWIKLLRDDAIRFAKVAVIVFEIEKLKAYGRPIRYFARNHTTTKWDQISEQEAQERYAELYDNRPWYQLSDGRVRHVRMLDAQLEASVEGPLAIRLADAYAPLSDQRFQQLREDFREAVALATMRAT